jgi:hypothetical protein
MAAAYAYTRVLGTAASVCRSLPTLSGANGAHLVLKSDGEQVGPPAGARRFGARWRRGRIEGDADILVMPVADWGCEVHVTVRSPGSPAGFALARTKRLSAIALDLAAAIRDAVPGPTQETAAGRERRAAAKRWPFALPGEAAR